MVYVLDGSASEDVMRKIEKEGAYVLTVPSIYDILCHRRGPIIAEYMGRWEENQQLFIGSETHFNETNLEKQLLSLCEELLHIKIPVTLVTKDEIIANKADENGIHVWCK